MLDQRSEGKESINLGGVNDTRNQPLSHVHTHTINKSHPIENLVASKGARCVFGFFSDISLSSSNSEGARRFG